jgi:hypothetical protein
LSLEKRDSNNQSVFSWKRLRSLQSTLLGDLMFVLTKASNLRNRTAVAVRELVIKIFNLDDVGVKLDDDAWESWLSLKNQREPCNILELLELNVRDSLKARCLAIYLVPTLRMVPYHWSDESSLRNYLFMANEIKLSELSPRLQEFAFELIRIYASYAILHLKVPTLVESRERNEIIDSLLSYNSFILQALQLLPETDQCAMALYQCYQLLDPVPYCTMDDVSGYDSFGRLLTKPVPERWKLCADEAMRTIVRLEVSGQANPRYEWEAALSQYAECIILPLFVMGLTYSRELFASQIDFVLEVSGNGDHCYFPTHRLAWIFAQITGDEARPLRHRLIRHVMLTPDGFNVYDANDLSLARWFAIELAEDNELVSRLNEMIQAYQTRLSARMAEQQKAEEQANAVMAAMR